MWVWSGTNYCVPGAFLYYLPQASEMRTLRSLHENNGLVNNWDCIPVRLMSLSYKIPRDCKYPMQSALLVA